MSTPPYVPIFVADYLGDTIELSIEEHGAYFLLLLTAWKQPSCDLPDDDKKLSRICRVSLRKWKQIRVTMEEFWTVEGGRWKNERLQKERVYVENRSNSAREAANARWKSQDTENKGSGSCDGNADADAGAYANADAPQPQPQIEEPSGSSPPPPPTVFRKRDWPEIPDWIPVEQWNAFIDMRDRKRAMPTARAAGMLINKLTEFRSEGHDPGGVLDQSTLKNWTDLYRIKDQNDDRTNDQANRGPAAGNRGQRDRRDSFTRAIDDSLGLAGPDDVAGEDRRRDDGVVEGDFDGGPAHARLLR